MKRRAGTFALLFSLSSTAIAALDEWSGAPQGHWGRLVDVPFHPEFMRWTPSGQLEVGGRRIGAGSGEPPRLTIAYPAYPAYRAYSFERSSDPAQGSNPLPSKVDDAADIPQGRLTRLADGALIDWGGGDHGSPLAPRIARLLADGRVVVGKPSAHIDQEGSNLRGQIAIYWPSYLFDRDGSGRLARRPVIEGAPKSVLSGREFEIRVDDVRRIRSAVLVATDGEPASAYVLDAKRRAPVDRLHVAASATGIAVPAGDYLFAVVDSAGVPSVAAPLTVERADGARVAPQANSTTPIGVPSTSASTPATTTGTTSTPGTNAGTTTGSTTGDTVPGLAALDSVPGVNNPNYGRSQSGCTMGHDADATLVALALFALLGVVRRARQAIAR